MRRITRLHEWLADHFTWVNYPKPRVYVPRLQPVSLRRRAAYRWGVMPPKQRGWVYFAAFWGFLVLASIYGNFAID